jgi:hypothetical protein
LHLVAQGVGVDIQEGGGAMGPVDPSPARLQRLENMTADRSVEIHHLGGVRQWNCYGFLFRVLQGAVEEKRALAMIYQRPFHGVLKLPYIARPCVAA